MPHPDGYIFVGGAIEYLDGREEPNQSDPRGRFSGVNSISERNHVSRCEEGGWGTERKSFICV